MDRCASCGHLSIYAEVGSGLHSCTRCGDTSFKGFGTPDTWSANENLAPRTCYTRQKRFKKYLARACRNQSQTTVPDETWAYLLDKGPYHGPREVLRTLKKARHLKRKCYDSLPFMVQSLCNCEVPILTQSEREECLKLFDTVDMAYANGPFISYLYVLEYILHKISRSDVCPFLSRIQCRKRRAKYGKALDKVFGTHTYVSSFTN